MLLSYTQFFFLLRSLSLSHGVAIHLLFISNDDTHRTRSHLLRSCLSNYSAAKKPPSEKDQIRKL